MDTKQLRTTDLNYVNISAGVGGGEGEVTLYKSVLHWNCQLY